MLLLLTRLEWEWLQIVADLLLIYVTQMHLCLVTS